MFCHISQYRLLSVSLPIHSRSVSSRSPRVRTITFIPCNRRIYRMEFGQYWTLLSLASSSTLIRPYMRFLFVGSGFCLRLPSDSTSRWTPLPLANSSCCQVCSGLSPPSYRTCRAHRQKGVRLIVPPSECPQILLRSL